MKLLGIVALSLCCVTAGAAQQQQQQQPPPKRPTPKTPAKPATTPQSKEPAKKAAPPPPDLVVKTQYVAGDKKTTSTAFARGQRARIDYGTEISAIAQCDAGQLVQINDTGKRFFVTPLVPPPAAEPAGKPPKKGGVITYTTTVTDTGERKPLFGAQARHVKTVLTKEPSADACDTRRERIETDGWFIDTPSEVQCSIGDRRASFVVTSGCRDEVRYAEASSRAGYPLAYATTTTVDEKASTATMEVTSFERTTLPDALFAVPDGYKETKTLADLTAPPKRAGVRRVGVVRATSKATDPVSLDALSDTLVASLNDADIDAVPLEASSMAGAVEEAPGKAVDYVLITTVADIRKPQKGIVGRVSGAKDYGAKLDFMLIAPGSATPVMASSERSGTSTLQAAVTTAKTVSRYMTPMGLLASRFNFMQTFSAVSGSNPTAMQQSPDPAMKMLFTMLDATLGETPPSQDIAETADAAVATALKKEVAAIVARLAK